MPRLVFISDTHLSHQARGTAMPSIPYGDILVHCGDLTFQGTFIQVLAELRWLASLPHRYKVFIAGNHDWLFQKSPEMARTALLQAMEAVGAPADSMHYLQDSGTTLMGLRFWGSPWTPRFCDWAFQLDRNTAPAHWAAIPEDLDVLITHGPAFGILDKTPRGDQVGDRDLWSRLKAMCVGTAPVIHAFGHIHHQGGTIAKDPKLAGTLSINASLCDEIYRPVNQVVVVEL